MTSEAAFFARTGEATFEPSVLTRGPWSPHHQHGGPPSALLARAIEEALDESLVLTRVIVELPRPVPIAPLEVRLGPLEGGRNVKRIEARLLTEKGLEVCTARAMLMARPSQPTPESEPAPPGGPGPGGLSEEGFPFFGPDPGYDKAIEVRFARGTWGSGDVLAWMRMRVPLVAGEPPSPLVRALVVADSGSGVSQRLPTESFTFINPDVVIGLSRLPEGEWIGLESRTDANAEGFGLADTRLLDIRGGFGRAVQSLLVRPR